MRALAEQDITNLKTTQRVNAGISLMPQEDPVFPNMTVAENLEMGGWLIRNENEKRETLNEMYRLFARLNERKRQKAGSLSGGERQMLAVARALMIKPRLLVMDEPSLGLAPLAARQVYETLGQVGKRNTTILLVEQNARMALGIADYGYIMEVGRIVLEGSSKDLKENEHVQELYLGTGKDKGPEKGWRFYTKKRRW